MIKSFQNRDTENIFNGIRVKRFPDEVRRAAQRRLKYLNNAVSPEDLRIPPGNHFEALAGRPGFYSIRINIQWRITFRWNEGAEGVCIEDYH